VLAAVASASTGVKMPQMNAGALVISLDFELYWGVRDKRTLADYGRNILGGREVIPALLDLFAAHKIGATWATVGFLFCADKEELLASLPYLRPSYGDPNLSPYDDLATLGPDERRDPYHFGQSLVRRISAYDGQEIGTHTFSHFYCLEEGGAPEVFRADLEAAKTVAARLGIAIESLVFPRNQVGCEHLRIAHELGLSAFRGNQRVWFHRASKETEQSLGKRAARFADSYLPIAGHHVHEPQVIEGMVDVVASRFLRPVRGGWLDRVLLERICAEMTHAAKTRTLFHLWWHPHNFGAAPSANVDFLRRVLDCFARLQDRFGIQSLNMGAVARRVRACQSYS